MTALLKTAGIVGDVHGEDEALEAALCFLKAEIQLDALLCTGDVPAKKGVGNTDRVCQLLHDADVLTIRGNHDRWMIESEGVADFFNGDDKAASLETRAFLHSLPPFREFETPLGRLLLCHGIARDDMSGIYPGGNDDEISRALESYGLPGKYRLMVNGHTHRRMVRPLPDFTIINAGSLRWEENPGFLIADFAAATVHLFNITPFTYQITAAGSIGLPA